MKVSEAGEFGLIERIVAELGRSGPEPGAELLIGIGDDAAAWRVRESVQIATTDAMVENVHFQLDNTTWEDVGWRALASNLSDIAAMGGAPDYALVALALPGETEVEDVLALYRGMKLLADEFGVTIIGGDVVSAPQVVVSITVVGTSPTDSLLRRSAARPGDLVAVTGELGGSAGGLAVLSGAPLPAEDTASLKQAFLRPRPRVAEGQQLVTSGIRAAIDISDGLVADLTHICRLSQVGAQVDVDRLPLPDSLKQLFGKKARDMALAGGEDYELLFTAPADRIAAASAALSVPVTVIGVVRENAPGHVELVDGLGRPYQIVSTGWEHFRAGQQSP